MMNRKVTEMLCRVYLTTTKNRTLYQNAMRGMQDNRYQALMSQRMMYLRRHMFSTDNKNTEERIGINIFTGEQVKQPAKPEGET
jgi:hypothetical protein